MKKKLRIFLLARNSHKKRIDSIIESLQKLKTQYYDVVITVWSYIHPTQRDVNNIELSTNLKTFLNKDSSEYYLVLADQMDERDLDLIKFFADNGIPIVFEKKMERRYGKYIKTIDREMIYSHLHPEKLLVTVPRVLQRCEYLGLKKLKVQLPPIIENQRITPPSETNITIPNRGVSKAEVVDLVIINYNALELLKKCINSIIANTRYPHNLIVVDNNSTDGSIPFLRQKKGITLIENGFNLGYASACNQGIMAGKGEFVVVLNNDLKLTPGWLTAMVKTAMSDNRIGVVGPRMVNDKNLIVGAGVVHLDEFCTSRGMGVTDEPGIYDTVQDCYSVGGACYLIRRKALEEVGGFDENYFFYYEETDLSLRMLEKGYRVVYTPKAKIIHYHEGSLNKRNPVERYRRNVYFEESKNRFLDKWNGVLSGKVKREYSRDIVVFGIIPWGFRFQRPQQICTRLAEQGYRILYINNVCQKNGSLERLRDNLYVFSPSGNGVIYNHYSFNQKREIVKSIYQVFDKLKIYNPILWVDVPYWTEIITYFDREMIFYNCMDSYSHFSDLQKFCPDLEEREKSLCSIATTVFASSKLLQEKLLKYNENVILIPNGVDLNHFTPFRKYPIPEDLKTIPQPIIGYYGAIAEWIDLDLIKYVAERMPDHSFVFMGLVTVDVACLKSKGNIFFLGEKPYSSLPGYLHYFKTAIIPFKKNLLSMSTNPVKLYEYLAAGKSVVSVDLPEIRQFKDVVYIARNYEEFLFLLQQVDDKPMAMEKGKRSKAVQGNDWHNRIRDILRAIGLGHSKQVEKSLINKLRKNL